MSLPRQSTYGRRTIMADAIAQARTARASLGLSWREALALALRTAWTVAKRRAENLLAAAQPPSRPASPPAISSSPIATTRASSPPGPSG